jgi:hypothetical protein
MPIDGFLAVQVANADGKWVRHLTAEIEHKKGLLQQSWDLKDDEGTPVPPGTYRWSALARPPFSLTYENTVFNAGQPPWPSAPRGPRSGAWMGDHGFPVSVTSVGDKVFLGSNVAESGDAVIGTDLEGTKLWGHWTFGGFLGPWRMASDGRYAYLIVPDEGVKRADPQNGFAMRSLMNFPYSREFTKGTWTESRGGAAAFDGKLYVSFCGKPPPWLVPSLSAGDIDPLACDPKVRLSGRIPQGGCDRGYYEYDEIMALCATFLTGYPSLVTASFGGTGPRGKPLKTLTAAFRKPVPVGTVLLPDGDMQVYALKPGARLPSEEPGKPKVDMGDEPTTETEAIDDFEEEHERLFPKDTWAPVPVSGESGAPALACVPAGAGLRTEALRFKTCEGSSKLHYALILRHRFEDVAPPADRVYTDGAGTKGRGWSVTFQQGRPINPSFPAVMLLVWPEPVTLRGVSLIRPATGTIAIDCWRGAPDVDPRSAVEDDASWAETGTLRPEIAHRYFVQPASVRTLDFLGNVTTRALRLRALTPAGSLNPYTGRDEGVAFPHRTGFEAIVAYHYLGEGVPEPPAAPAERITEIQLPEKEGEPAKILRNIALKEPGNLAFDKNGTLYAVSGSEIVAVPLSGSEEPKVVIGKDSLLRPTGMAMDSDGLLYVADWGRGWGNAPLPLHQVKVFDPSTGRQVRVIGTPGGPQVGPWDPTRMNYPSMIAFDRAGKLWVTEAYYQPKRVSRWSRDGKLEKSFLGPTYYGGSAGGQCGGGEAWMDPRNRSVVNFDGMKFVIDWETKSWRLASLIYGRGFGTGKGRYRPFLTRHTRGAAPNRVAYCQGRRYLLGDPSRGSVALICEERDEVAIPLAAAGNLAALEEIDERPDLKKVFGKINRSQFGFCWVDRNADAEPQVDEIQLTDRSDFSAGYVDRIGEDLSFRFPQARLRPTTIRPDGTPVYDMASLEILPILPRDRRQKHSANSSWTTADGRTFFTYDRLVAQDGKTVLWTYLDRWITNFGAAESGYGPRTRPPGVLAGEFITIGHFTLGQEEFFATNSDPGDWFLFTGDGMLVGCVFGGPVGYGKREWTMPQWEPGKVDLSDVRLKQEHYGGSICAAEDGMVYAIAGHNHLSIVRVDGLEGIRRMSGTLTVTMADVVRAREADVDRAVAIREKGGPKTAPLPFLEERLVDTNGRLLAWLSAPFLTVREHEDKTQKKIVKDAEVSLMYDRTFLYVSSRVQDDSPMVNSARHDDPDQLRQLFKSGDALDILLGLDPAADPKRKAPAAGDLRLLVTQLAGQAKLTLMLYRYVVPGSSPDKRVCFRSPIAETWTDEVREVTDAQVALTRERTAWRLEASIPWKSLGAAAPEAGTRIRGDAGVLWSDPEGIMTVDRDYWSGKANTMVSDLAIEAGVIPALWGELSCPDSIGRELSEPDP